MHPSMHAPIHPRSAGAGSAVECPVGSYCPANTAAPIPCNWNKISPKRSVSVSACVAAAGYYGFAGTLSLTHSLTLQSVFPSKTNASS